MPTHCTRSFSQFTLACALVIALAACSGGSDGGSSPTPAPDDHTPVTATSAAGLWKLHYDWAGPPPESWTSFFGSSATGDCDIAIPSDTQKRGMFGAAGTAFGFAPMSSFVDDGGVKWSFSLSGASGPFTLDFTGRGTASSLSGDAKFSNDVPSAKWTASKVTTTVLAPESIAGDWTLDFQWARRTPGTLLVTCDGKGTCTIPHGQDGGPTTDDVGAVSFIGNRVVVRFPDATHLGVAVTDGRLWGYMDSSNGSTGLWKASRGRPEPIDADPGCTADVDCGHCERCERTTGKCVARLTC